VFDHVTIRVSDRAASDIEAVNHNR